MRRVVFVLRSLLLSVCLAGMLANAAAAQGVAGQRDPRIGKLNYEFVGYATGSTLFDFRYHGRVMDQVRVRYCKCNRFPKNS